MSYCNDLAKELDAEKCQDQSSELLALAKAKTINKEYSILPENGNESVKNYLSTMQNGLAYNIIL
ncbi:MAG: hypothetical protein LRY67_01935 [Gammaproteobacteria bacterium]|nr:hypothetical protein [Gammaproteobacteria bacterium]